MTARHANGQWRAGQSSNPGGRPGGVSEVRELARRHTPAAIERLVKEMSDGDTSHARIAAANALLDRGWGKPTQPLAGNADEPPIVTSNEERREQLRALVAKAFAQVVDDHPEMTDKAITKLRSGG